MSAPVTREALRGPLRPAQAPGRATGPGDPARPVAPRQSATARPPAPSPSARVPVVGDAYLTPREVQVLRLIAQGRPTAQIARALNLSQNTVKTHVSRMAQRLRVPSREALVAAGTKARVVPPPPVPVRLDPAERQLRDLIADGLTYREIGARQRQSVPTVKYRAGLLMRRVGAEDRAHLVWLTAAPGPVPRRPAGIPARDLVEALGVLDGATVLDLHGRPVVGDV